ncbi:unnamed protein product, partial [Allacma fusca]
TNYLEASLAVTAELSF